MPFPLEPFAAGFMITSGAGANPSPTVPTSSLTSPIFTLKLIQILGHSSMTLKKKKKKKKRKDKPPAR